jgi:ribosomal protein S11
MIEVEVKVKGPGSGREQAILNLQNAGLKITGSKTSRRCPTTAAVPRKSDGVTRRAFNGVACDARSCA